MSCVEALEVLYRKHAHQLRGYLRSLLRTTSELGLSTGAVADDLTHDTFLCALSSKACAEYDPNRDYSPYLRAIAHSRFIDAVRARRREVPYGGPELTPEPDQCITVESLCDPSVTRVLRAHLESLPPELRLVFEQRYLLDRSQPEVCATLGMSRRVLRTKEAQLKRGLQRALQLKGNSKMDPVIGTAGQPFVPSSSFEAVSMDSPPMDKNRLAMLERVIAHGGTWTQVAEALSEVRNSRLYRQVAFKSFEIYCLKRWGIRRRYAYRLIDAAAVMRHLSHAASDVPLPKSERQARELAKLKEPIKQVEAWTSAVRTAPGGRLTARHVALTVSQHLSRLSVLAVRATDPSAARGYGRG